jgi:hypothetical protein
MDSLCWSAFNQFSYPGMKADESFFAAVAEAYANIGVDQILQPHLRPSIENHHLFENLARWLGRTKPLRDVWFTSVGKLGAYVLGRERAASADLLGRVILDIADQFGEFSAIFELIDDTPLLVGQYVIMPRDRLFISRSGPILRVRIGERPSALCQYNVGSAKLTIEATQGRSLHGTGGFRIIQTGQTVGQLLNGSKHGLPLRWEALGDFNREQVIIDGLSLLKELTPEFMDWTSRVVNTIIVVSSVRDPDCSGSWPDSPGTIYLSEPQSALKAAEVLVHEACHQYFHMAERISSSTRPGEARLFYSPSVGKDRPLDRILLAYHAFANILNFYAALVQRGYRDAWMFNRIAALKGTVGILQTSLMKANGLSELGLAIFLPLKSTLANNLRLL